MRKTKTPRAVLKGVVCRDLAVIMARFYRNPANLEAANKWIKEKKKEERRKAREAARLAE